MHHISLFSGSLGLLHSSPLTIVYPLTLFFPPLWLKHLHGFLEYHVPATFFFFTMKGWLVSSFNNHSLFLETRGWKSKKYRLGRISGTFSSPWEGHASVELWMGSVVDSPSLLRLETLLYSRLWVGQSFAPWPRPILPSKKQENSR